MHRIPNSTSYGYPSTDDWDALLVSWAGILERCADLEGKSSVRPGLTVLGPNSRQHPRVRDVWPYARHAGVSKGGSRSAGLLRSDAVKLLNEDAHANAQVVTEVPEVGRWSHVRGRPVHPRRVACGRRFKWSVAAGRERPATLQRGTSMRRRGHGRTARRRDSLGHRPVWLGRAARTIST
jgi:hypothetical protein